MNKFRLAAVCLAALTACSTAPKTEAGLETAMPLHPIAPASPVANYADSNALVYRAPNINFSDYHGIYVPPAIIYAGPDADFGNISVADKQTVAAYLTMAFAKALERHHLRVATAPGPGIVTLQLTLAGVTDTRPVASLARLTPIGVGVTALKTAAGLPAAFVGSITVGGELIDNKGKVLGGFVTKESPLAYDLRSSIGTTMTAELAADRGAGDFASAIVTLKDTGQ